MTNEFHLELFPGAANSGHPCTCDIGENHLPSAKVTELHEAQAELADLARRMAADEANEGNFAAAAELQAAADTAPDYDAPMNRGPLGPDTKAAVAKALEESRGLYLETVAEQEHEGYDRHTGEADDPTERAKRIGVIRGEHGPELELPEYVSHGMRYRGDPDAPTGPLTPGQVTCVVCRLDDRTRAASDPKDGLCDVCREDTPNRIRRERMTWLEQAAEMLFGLGERDPIHEDETAGGSAERDLRRERVDTLMKLADLVEGHPLPYSLVHAAETDFRHVLVPGQIVRQWGIADRPTPDGIQFGVDGPVGFPLRLVVEYGELRLRQDQSAVLSEPGPKLQMNEVPGRTTTVQHELDAALARIKELEAAERSRRFVEKSLDRLKPQLARRIADVICPPPESSDQDKDTWLQSRATAVTAAERLVEQGLRFVPSTPEAELAAEHLGFIVACTKEQTFLQEWDGQLYGMASAAVFDLTEVREQINRAGTRAPEATNWGVFGLVRVPDETVFGKQADHG